MRVATVHFLDMSAYPVEQGRTGMLTEEHEPELLADGWVRFKTKDGQWHRVPPGLIRRVTEFPPPQKISVEVIEQRVDLVASKPEVAPPVQQPVTAPQPVRRGRPPKQ